MEDLHAKLKARLQPIPVYLGDEHKTDPVSVPRVILTPTTARASAATEARRSREEAATRITDGFTRTLSVECDASTYTAAENLALLVLAALREEYQQPDLDGELTYRTYPYGKDKHYRAVVLTVVTRGVLTVELTQGLVESVAATVTILQE